LDLPDDAHVVPKAQRPIKINDPSPLKLVVPGRKGHRDTNAFAGTVRRISLCAQARDGKAQEVITLHRGILRVAIEIETSPFPDRVPV